MLQWTHLIAFLLTLVASTLSAIAHALPGDTKLISRHAQDLTARMTLQNQGVQLLGISDTGDQVLIQGPTSLYPAEFAAFAPDVANVPANLRVRNMSFIPVSAGVSGNGRYLLIRSPDLIDPRSGFVSDRGDTFLVDLETVSTRWIFGGKDFFHSARGFSGFISRDGRFSVASHSATGPLGQDNTIDLFDREDGSETVISRNSAGAMLNGENYALGMGYTGRYVLFASTATNLASTDQDGRYDIYLLDRVSGTSRLISRNSAGTKGSGDSSLPVAVMNSNVRYVVMSTAANGLISGDNDNEVDLYVHDIQLQQTSAVSVSLPGVAATERVIPMALSGDGKILLFTLNNDRIYVRDMTSGVVTEIGSCAEARGRVGVGCDRYDYDGRISDYRRYRGAALSEDGRYVYYETEAAGDLSLDFNFAKDIYRRDLLTGQVLPISTSPPGYYAGTESATGGSAVTSISADGKTVTLVTSADDIVIPNVNLTAKHYVFDTLSGAYTTLPIPEHADSVSIRRSEDGRYLTYSAFQDPNQRGYSGEHLFTRFNYNYPTDTWLLDTSTGAQRRLFNSTPTSLTTGHWTGQANLSADGKYIAFATMDPELLSNDTNLSPDVVVLDQVAGTLERISVGMNQTSPNGSSFGPQISHDGRTVVFESLATNLVPNDYEPLRNLYSLDRQSRTTSVISPPVENGDTRFRFGDDAWVYSSRANKVIALMEIPRVAFNSVPSRLYVHDLSSRRWSQVADRTEQAFMYPPMTVSADGTHVGFRCGSTWDTRRPCFINLESMQRGFLDVASVDQVYHSSDGPPLFDGSAAKAVFSSLDDDLVGNDGNKRSDGFLHEVDKARLSFELRQKNPAPAVRAGESAQAELTLSFGTDYRGTVSLSCSELPANASCSFSPAGIRSNGVANHVAVTVSTIRSTTTGFISPTQQGVMHASLLPFPLWTLYAFPLWAMLWLSRRFEVRKFSFLALMVALLPIGCGGSGGSGPSVPPPNPNAVAPGNYTIKVVATDGIVSATTSLLVNVTR